MSVYMPPPPTYTPSSSDATESFDAVFMLPFNVPMLPCNPETYWQCREGAIALPSLM
jgi:hypothetical protein